MRTVIFLIVLYMMHITASCSFYTTLPRNNQPRVNYYDASGTWTGYSKGFNYYNSQGIYVGRRSP